MIKLICNKFENVQRKDIGSIQLAFLDPPDNKGVAYDGFDDNIGDDLYACFLRQWIEKACRFTDGPVFISIAERWVGEVEHLIRTKQVKLVRRLYWHYTFGQNNKRGYSPCLRPIYWLNRHTIYPKNILVPSARQLKYKDKRASPEGKMPENVWEFSRVCGTFKERRSYHPTQHPESLMKRIILGHSKAGDTVLDPFVGSGTTAYVCDDTGRNCIGIEQSQHYINKIHDELENRKNG